MRVLGADAAGKAGWVAVVLEHGRFVGAQVGPDLGALIGDGEPVDAVGVDIPIGCTPAGPREADRLARSYVGVRRSSVFAAPPAAVWGVDRYEQANDVLATSGRPKLSRQSWALLSKIREADALARSDERVREVHPEVSFRTMAGEDLASKKTWAGATRRRRLLEDHGVHLPDDLDAAGRVAVDDVLDAAAVAWSADRVARGEAESLPSPPEPGVDGARVAIWY